MSALRLCLLLGIAVHVLAVVPSVTWTPLTADAVKVLSGEWRCRNEAVSVGGQVFHTSYYPNVAEANIGYRTEFDVRGWAQFSAWFGIIDGSEIEKAMVTVEVDGEKQFSVVLRHGKLPVKANIPLNRAQSLSITYAESGKAWNASAVGVFLPCLSKWPFVESQAQASPAAPAAVAATFIIEPCDIDKLANNLCRQIQLTPALAQRMADSNLAVATFKLIDIASASIADNVAEDLTTALVKNGMQTIERGQLIAVLEELHIQDSGLIDPATALKIGLMTGCNVIIAGSISDRGQFIVINARLLDTATGKTLIAERVEINKIAIKY